MTGETNKLLVIQPIHPSSQSPSLIESKGNQLGLSSYLFVALPQGPYPMISFNGATIANPKIVRFVHPIHSPKDRVFQIGSDNETREKVRSLIFQINRISTKTSTTPAKYKLHNLLAVLRESQFTSTKLNQFRHTSPKIMSLNIREYEQENNVEELSASDSNPWLG